MVRLGVEQFGKCAAVRLITIVAIARPATISIQRFLY
jgi:hypothetical protein